MKFDLSCFYGVLVDKCAEFASLVASFSVSMMGFIATVVTILFSMNSPHIDKYKKFGYFQAILVYFAILSFLSIALYVLSLLCYMKSVYLVQLLFVSAIVTSVNYMSFFFILILNMNRSIKRKC